MLLNLSLEVGEKRNTFREGLDKVADLGMSVLH